MTETCGICQEETMNVSAEFVTLPCASRHAFHPDCIKPWLSGGEERNGSCPFCRASLLHTCGHALAEKYLKAGKVIDSSVLASPCRPRCHGWQNETRAEQERILSPEEHIRLALEELYRETARLISVANRLGYPHLIPSYNETYDRHRAGLLQRAELLGIRNPAERMPNPLRQVTLGSALGSSASNPINHADDDDNIE
ncbi:hypothetical protein PG991_002467 [Apiospora marii]|uniref:RING-type domain-containing protein n=2 Tax=Apiospora marii TaxID=335849 RepID=A0ABR1SFK1_9PEZI